MPIINHTDMKYLKLLLLGLLITVSSKSFAQEDPHAKSGLIKVIVQEVLQVESYTYLYVIEGEEKKWLAAPRMEAQLGEIYYYKGGMMMKDFKSNELDRIFEEVTFLSKIMNADFIDASTGRVNKDNYVTEAETSREPLKLGLAYDSIEGRVSVAELLENMSKYGGKKVKVAGKVTKFNSGILGKNWIHVSDGTSFEGNDDFMITSQEIFMVGDEVILEGIVGLDRDFGAGYFYKIILEEAVHIK